jgi:hypothetical protein
MPDQQQHELTRDEQVNAIKTWRYLRLSMIAMVFGIAVAIGFEWWKTHPHCFQGSISAYYYTPVRAFFVGALVAIGVALVSLKGNNEVEDVLLNLAGAFAPAVAFVPTPGTGHCASVLSNADGRNTNIGNNVFALLAVGLAGLLLVWVLLRAARQGLGLNAPAPIGWWVAFGVWLVAAVVFVGARGFFVTVAHYTAAILMFVCIFLVVRSNASNTAKPRLRTLYLTVSWAMVGSAVVFGALGLLHWDYWVIGIEAALILLFGVFWLIQTKDLWHEGLR